MNDPAPAPVPPATTAIALAAVRRLPINDRHGHLIGDDILRRVATALVAEFRPYDALARYGGDEFVIVLPGLDEAGAERAGERVRSAIETAAAAFGDLSLALTVSVGVAGWREPLTAGELVDRADRALLLAKRGGRGAVVLSSDETEREFSELEAGVHSSPLLAGLWDVVSRNERTADLLRVLPPLLHRELDLQEAAVYEPSPGAGGVMLVRVAAARPPGDPAPRAFRELNLSAAAAVGRRLAGGPSPGSRSRRCSRRSACRSGRRRMARPPAPARRSAWWPASASTASSSFATRRPASRRLRCGSPTWCPARPPSPSSAAPRPVPGRG
jgi:diguanylate cyclase (GGDEF)-like protein